MELDDLRDDYKQDYVLMVAKYYQKEKDLAAAQAMLEKIEPDQEELLLLVQNTLDMLDERNTDEITATIDIQSVLILQQALSPGSSMQEVEVAA